MGDLVFVVAVGLVCLFGVVRPRVFWRFRHWRWEFKNPDLVEPSDAVLWWIRVVNLIWAGVLFAVAIKMVVAEVSQPRAQARCESVLSELSWIYGEEGFEAMERRADELGLDVEPSREGLRIKVTENGKWLGTYDRISGSMRSRCEEATAAMTAQRAGWSRPLCLIGVPIDQTDSNASGERLGVGFGAGAGQVVDFEPGAYAFLRRRLPQGRGERLGPEGEPDGLPAVSDWSNPVSTPMGLSLALSRTTTSEAASRLPCTVTDRTAILGPSHWLWNVFFHEMWLRTGGTCGGYGEH